MENKVISKEVNHSLKILPEYFEDVKSGLKKFEIRRNDRHYQIGDILELREFIEGKYTGNKCFVRVNYMTDYAQRENYVVLGIE